MYDCWLEGKEVEILSTSSGIQRVSQEESNLACLYPQLQFLPWQICVINFYRNRTGYLLRRDSWFMLYIDTKLSHCLIQVQIIQIKYILADSRWSNWWGCLGDVMPESPQEKKCVFRIAWMKKGIPELVRRGRQWKHKDERGRRLQRGFLGVFRGEDGAWGRGEESWNCAGMMAHEGEWEVVSWMQWGCSFSRLTAMKLRIVFGIQAIVFRIYSCGWKPLRAEVSDTTSSQGYLQSPIKS